MLGAIQLDLITGFLSFLFTVLILSYLVGDNPAFRLAIHAFIGVSAGYVAMVVFRQIIIDKLFLPLATGNSFERILLIFPLVMSLMLLGKTSAGLEWMGRPVVALLVGVGTAAAVGGALLGTFFPQFFAAVNMFDMRSSILQGNVAGSFITGGFALLGTVVTLAYFQFSVFGKNKNSGKRGWLMAFIAILGQVFISITLGAIFSGVLTAALTALVERAQSLVLFIGQIISNFIS
jgi:hypothetical protein